MRFYLPTSGDVGLQLGELFFENLARTLGSRNSQGNVKIWGYGACGARPIPPNLGATPAIPRELENNFNEMT